MQKVLSCLLTLAAAGGVFGATVQVDLSGVFDRDTILAPGELTDGSGGDFDGLDADIGAGYARDVLQVWHYDDTEGWTPFDAVDLSYDGQYANFTVTGFSGYAVSGVMVPEPGTLAMLIAAGLAVMGYARWKRT